MLFRSGAVTVSDLQEFFSEGLRDACAGVDAPSEDPPPANTTCGGQGEGACADAAGEWFLPATTKAECLAFLGCEETFGHEVTSKSKAECDKCKEAPESEDEAAEDRGHWHSKPGAYHRVCNLVGRHGVLG